MASQQLLAKITVGGQELKNRVVLAPMTRARATPTEDPFDRSNTNPNDIMADYYAQRATAGLMITEATAVSEMGSGWLNAPHIRTPDNVQGWKKVVEKVHEKNGKIYIQLWHMGRQSHSSFHPSTNKIVSASDIPVKGAQARTIHGETVAYEKPHAMTIEEIKETIDDFVRAARLAKEAGFDGVEVHSANGYLIDQFLQSSSNRRTDQYGGSMENRVRFLREIVEGIIQDGAYPANRIGFRLSPNGNYGDMGSEDNDVMFPYVAKTMNAYGLAYLHVMDGHGFGFHGKTKSVTAADLRKHFDGVIIGNVGLSKGVAEGMIRSGAVDLAAFGRLFISNPDLVERFANDWPLEPEAPYEAWWYPTGAKGYTDFPAYKPNDEEVESSEEKKEE